MTAISLIFDLHFISNFSYSNCKKCGKFFWIHCKIFYPNRPNLPHVANDSPPLQPWSVGPGAIAEIGTAHSWHQKGIKSSIIKILFWFFLPASVIFYSIFILSQEKRQWRLLDKSTPAYEFDHFQVLQLIFLTFFHLISCLFEVTMSCRDNRRKAS